MKLKLRPIFKDISLTYVTEAIVMVAFFVTFRLIARNFGPEGVGEYSLVRRVIAFFNPLLLLGFGIGFPRYIAMSKDKNQRSCYVKTAATIVMSFAILSLLIITPPETWEGVDLFDNKAVLPKLAFSSGYGVYAVRTSQYKLIFHDINNYMGRDGYWKKTGYELYDLISDPGEKNDISSLKP